MGAELAAGLAGIAAAPCVAAQAVGKLDAAGAMRREMPGASRFGVREWAWLAVRLRVPAITRGLVRALRSIGA